MGAVRWRPVATYFSRPHHSERSGAATHPGLYRRQSRSLAAADRRGEQLVTPTDLSETSLELLIMSDLTGVSPEAIRQQGAAVAERGLASYDTDWVIGRSEDFDRSLGIDTAQLFAFLEATQPDIVEDLGIGVEGNARQQFLQRLSTAILSDGVLKVLRKGLGYHQHTVQLLLPVADAGQRQRSRAVSPQPLLGHAPIALQHRGDPARPRPGPLHQWAAGHHLRVEKHHHQPNRLRRDAAIPHHPQALRAALSLRRLPRPLRAG